MSKKIIKLLLLLVLSTVFTGCSCEHEWKDATCTNPKSCTLCGKSEGSVIEHIYESATCTTPKTCKVCNEITGDAIGHSFSEATYDMPKTCQRCGETEGTTLKLSDSCDKILASGTEDNGDVYELVANETETYEGSIVSVGVIKNNKWLLEMTSNMPLIDKDKTLYGTGVSGLDSAPKTIYYIGNGCFFYRNIYSWGWSGKTYQEIVYNCENGKYHELIEVDKSESNYPSYIVYEDKTIISKNKLKSNGYKVPALNDETIVWQSINYDRSGIEVTLLNIINMQTQQVVLGNCGLSPMCHPLSEGWFSITNYHGDFKFYDTSGKMVLDLSAYDLTHDEQPLFFVDGKCTFTIYNNSGSIYEITVNKKGEVINSREL